jgi:uncharacterized FAD-dependent dehydrogenase
MVKYDTIIVGAGPTGIFAAYELTLKAPNSTILLIDKGREIHKRYCPILDKKLTKCPTVLNDYPSCHPACSITSGFGGAGAYSDGKFNITSEYGGWLTDYLSTTEVEDLIKYVDAINLEHGANPDITDPTTDAVKAIERKGLAVGLRLLRSRIRHLGTEQNIDILKSIYEYLRKKVDMRYHTEVKELIIEDGKVKGVVTNNGEYESDNVIVAPGRDGSPFIKDMCQKHGVPMTNNQVDIGVRVETLNEVMEEINSNLYEGKFLFRTSVGTTVRTFCSNPSGHVVVENHTGTMLANGHSYRDKNLGSKNTNFALLVSHVFSEPFNQPNEYAHDVSSLANKLSSGSILVQTFGDILKGRRTNEKRLKESFVTPSLKEAVPGDLGLVLPYNTMKSLIEMVEALDHVTPGIASPHTLFYGVEAKFYSARPKVNNQLESPIKGLYFGGDGAGITRGLAQAGASGVHIARQIVKGLS